MNFPTSWDVCSPRWRPACDDGQRTTGRGRADLAIAPIPRNLPAVERHLDGKDDGSDEERGDRGPMRNQMTGETTSVAVLTCGGAQVTLRPGHFGAHHGDWF